MWHEWAIRFPLGQKIRIAPQNTRMDCTSFTYVGTGLQDEVLECLSSIQCRVCCVGRLTGEGSLMDDTDQLGSRISTWEPTGI
jgi:hypothetical protein